MVNADEQKATAAERLRLQKKITSKLNQPVYFKDVVTSEWKMENILCWGGVMPIFSQEKKSCVSNLIKIRYDKGRLPPPKTLTMETNKINKIDDVYMVMYMSLYTKTTL